jgi:high-affinity K+ transport system ATPase subunit B
MTGNKITSTQANVNKQRTELKFWPFRRHTHHAGMNSNTQTKLRKSSIQPIALSIWAKEKYTNLLA